MTQRASDRDAIIEEAADWAIELDAGPLGEADRARLLAWLRTSPVHVEEFLRMSAMFEDVSLTDITGNVEAIVPANDDAAAGKRPLKRLIPILSGAVAACALLAVGLSVLPEIMSSGPVIIEHISANTIKGEREEVVLEDGTRVTLNTDSEVEFLLTADMRAARIAKGEAFFSVARDVERPFYVIADDTAVRVLGTAFSTRLRDDGTELQVAEGRVAFGRTTELRALNASSLSELSIRDEVTLGAGDAAFWRDGAGRPERRTMASEEIAAWRSGLLVFRQTSLREVAAEFNRFNTEQIVVRSEDLAGETLSADFATDDVEGFLRFLEFSRPDSRVIRAGNEIYIDQD